MRYINTKTLDYPIHEDEIRQANKNVSFKTPFSPPSDYAPVYGAAQPKYDQLTQGLVEDTPVIVGNQWTQQWRVFALDASTIAKNRAEQASRIKEECVSSTQNRLDDFARTRNYDGILSACTYATSTVQKFKSDGQYCVNARDETWATLYRIMAEVEAGTRPKPTSFADIEAELPVLSWPA